MAKVSDPDELFFAVNATATTQEFELQTGALTIKANIGSTNLDDNAPGKTSGATGRALYSALKIEWLANPTLRKYKFPIKMIFEGSFIVTNGWTLLDDQTNDVMRDAGFNIAATSTDQSCMVSLGSIDAPASDQVYYKQADTYTVATTVTPYDKTGEINENIDTTTAKTYKKSFLRIQGKSFAEYNLLVEQGLSTLNFQAYSFPLSNGTDLKTDNVVNSSVYSDANVSAASEPYQSMTLTYLSGVGFTTATATTYTAGDVLKDTAGRWAYCSATGTLDAAGVADYSTNGGTGTFVAYEGEYQIGANYYAFNRVVDCATGTDREAYAWVQYQLRQATNINDDVVTLPAQGTFGEVKGEIAELLAEYVGDNLKPKPGVLFKNFDTNSTNSIQHAPITVDGGLDTITSVPLASSEVAFPFTAAGSMNFSDNLDLQTNSNTVYDMYFQYITAVTLTDVAVTASATNTCTLTFGGTGLDHLTNGDYITLTGFLTNEVNNTEYLVGTVTAGTSVTLTAVDSVVTLVDEIAGDSVTILENPFESLGAVLVNDNGGTPITGEVNSPTIPFDFDYTNNNQSGRTANSDAPIIVIALALDGAEWTSATHTISKSTGQSIAINSNDERNFSNPA